MASGIRITIWESAARTVESTGLRQSSKLRILDETRGDFIPESFCRKRTIGMTQFYSNPKPVIRCTYSKPNIVTRSVIQAK